MSKNNYMLNNQCRPVRQSLADTVELVKTQINYHDFYNIKIKSIPAVIRSFVIIMAEVLLLDPEEYIKINGSFMKVESIQEIYKCISYDHIELVYQKFKETRNSITKIKPYIRTMLYNSVYELDLYFDNQVSSAMT